MTTSTVVLVLAVFGACSVEMVEALTLVVASGVTRGWRSALEGAASAIVLLAALVGAVGLPLVHYVPLSPLRVVIGALLLVVGLGWLRKAILRASGHKDPHDEDAIYARTVEGLSRAPVAQASPVDSDGGRVASPDGLAAGAKPRRDAVGFAVAFKGVLLEGFEVLLIVVGLGSSSHRLGLAAISAAAAIVIVGAIGVAVARQLSEVPENAMKMGVGIMLTSFGLFWIGEGAGIHWPGSDLAILVLVGAFLLLAQLCVMWLKRLLPEPRRTLEAVGSAGPA